MESDPIFKDGFYVYANGEMIPESEAIEGLSIMHGPCSMKLNEELLELEKLEEK